jgi:simple sugar transport system ATP-binding protein
VAPKTASPAIASAGPPALELVGIEKSFGPVDANRGVSIRFARGSIHGVIGENGAGKSTLMSIVYGMRRPDSGTIRIDGQTVAMNGSGAAIANGVAMVHQHFMLVERFTILENLLLGSEPVFGMGKALAEARQRLAALQSAYGLTLPGDARIRDLSIGQRQSVEILKALYRDARILILDEPTSVLTQGETEKLFAILRRLRDAGRTVIFVSHKLDEIMALTDHVTVLRQGAVVGESLTVDTDRDRLAAMMIGHTVERGRNGAQAAPGPEVLSVRGLTVGDGRGIRYVDGIDLAVRAGEIVGIAGLAGSGQPRLLRALAGMPPIEAGEFRWRGQIVGRRDWNPVANRERGIAYVPDESARFGLVAEFTLAENAILGYERLAPASRRGLLDREKIRADCDLAIADFDIRPPLADLHAASLSGGNRQKLVLARELGRDPALLLIGELTQGMDIGAVGAIHTRLMALRAAGKGILLVSSDIDQIRALADRILVMSAGRIVGELAPEAASDARLGLMMGGVGGQA